jgi:hypothetical protein
MQARRECAGAPNYLGSVAISQLGERLVVDLNR